MRQLYENIQIMFPTLSLNNIISLVPIHSAIPVSSALLSATPLPTPQAIDLGTYGKGSARNIVWSPDGKLLAVESTAGGYIYDTATWELLASISTESLEDNSLRNLTFFPDNQSLLFIAGADCFHNILVIFHDFEISYRMQAHAA